MPDWLREPQGKGLVWGQTAEEDGVMKSKDVCMCVVQSVEKNLTFSLCLSSLLTYVQQQATEDSPVKVLVSSQCGNS